MPLSPEQQSLHLKAIQLCQKYQLIEWKIIQVLQQIDESKIYHLLEATSLFQYAVQFLKLSEPSAYMFISVARKSKIIPALYDAIQEQKLSVSKASRIVSVLDQTNSQHLIEFAENNSTRAIDFEVARLNPKAKSKETAKPISEDFIELKVCFSLTTYKKLKRAQAVMAQKQRKHLDMAQTMDAILDDYLKRQDPVEKAKRAVKKVQLCATEFNLCAQSELSAKPYVQTKPVASTLKAAIPKKLPLRSALPALVKHQVTNRDGGRCTYRDQKGNRCENERWLHLHHIRPVSLGGTNEIGNLTTLCSTHHDLVHQLSLPLEGQANWLRSPIRQYG